MSESQQDVMQIGAYQLRNLIQQNIGFQLLDLRQTQSVLEDPPWLKAAERLIVRVAPSAVLEQIRGSAASASDPIVVMCEDGTQSLSAALVLQNHSYINVFVLEGGVRSLVSS
jgi:rhodanese-related sulfurtransferase